jgi:hypothetical protein
MGCRGIRGVDRFGFSRARPVKETDYQGFWDALPHAAFCRDDWAVNEGFRQRYREEIIGLLGMLHRLGLVWGTTALHPSAPKECDLCGGKLADCQTFVDGVTADSRWAIMCPRCFLDDGLAVGPLTGQLYLQVGAGNWRLVVGSDPGGHDQTTLSPPKPIRSASVMRFLANLRARFRRPAVDLEEQVLTRRPMRCGTLHLMRGGRVAN